MMKNKQGKDTLAILAIMSGLLVAFIINYNSMSGEVSATRLLELYSERESLYSDIHYYDEYEHELTSRLEEYKKLEGEYEEIAESLTEEIEGINMLLGLTDVIGDGVVIRIEDAEVGPADGEYTSEQIIHDTDIVLIINDLKNAGAEAIAINGKRIVYSSYVECRGIYVDIDTNRVITPIEIEVIGNQAAINAYLDEGTTHYSSLITRGIQLEKYNKEKIELPGYLSELECRIMQNDNE